MMYKIRKGCFFRVFFSHKKLGNKRGKNTECCGQFELGKAGVFVQALAAHAVSDLVMVLGEHYKAGRGCVALWVSVSPFAISGLLSRVEEAISEKFREVCCPAIVGVIAVPVIGKGDAQCMVKVVVPLRVHTPAKFADRAYESRVIVGAFRNDGDCSTEFLRSSMDRCSEFFYKRKRSGVHNGVHSIEPQGVHMGVRDPKERVFLKKPPHVVSLCPVKVQGFCPRSAIKIREIGAEVGEVHALWAGMVVHHVQGDRESVRMAGIHEAA